MNYNHKQAEYFLATVDPAVGIILYGGGVGAGKTTAVIKSATDICSRLPGNNIAFVRNIRKDHATTTYQDFFEHCPPELIYDEKKEDHLIRLRTVDPNHLSNVYFLGLDDRKRWGGRHFGQIYVGEAAEVELRDLTYLTTRLRHNLPKTAQVPEDCPYFHEGSMHRFMSLDYNPPEEESHWLNELIDFGTIEGEPQPLKIIHTTTLDNLANLDKSYIDQLMKLPKNERERLVYGKRVFAKEGTPCAYSFIQDAHTFTTEVFPRSLKFIYTGIDFGWSMPVCCYFELTDGVAYLWKVAVAKQMDLREFIKSKLSVAEQMFEEAKIVDFVDHSHGPQHSDKGDKTSIEIMRDMGRNPRYKFSKPNWRAQLINALFQNNRLYIHDSCKAVINCLSYGWVRDKAGEIVKDGYWEHIADALGYGVWGMFGSTFHKNGRIKVFKDSREQLKEELRRTKRKKGYFSHYAK